VIMVGYTQKNKAWDPVALPFGNRKFSSASGSRTKKKKGIFLINSSCQNTKLNRTGLIEDRFLEYLFIYICIILLRIILTDMYLRNKNVFTNEIK